MVRSATLVATGPAEPGLGAQGEGAKPSSYEAIGDPNAKRMLREVEETLRQQTEALEMMQQSVECFPRRWSRFEVNTDRRKTLMLDLKSRKEGRPSLLNQEAANQGLPRGSVSRVSLQRTSLV